MATWTTHWLASLHPSLSVLLLPSASPPNSLPLKIHPPLPVAFRCLVFLLISTLFESSCPLCSQWNISRTSALKRAYQTLKTCMNIGISWAHPFQTSFLPGSLVDLVCFLSCSLLYDEYDLELTSYSSCNPGEILGVDVGTTLTRVIVILFACFGYCTWISLQNPYDNRPRYPSPPACQTDHLLSLLEIPHDSPS